MQTASNPLPPLSESDKARFWAKVNKDGPLPDQSNPHYVGLGPCWVWMAGKRNDGSYGRFWTCGRRLQAHRVAFSLAHGELSEDAPHVLHRCDNPTCCNPSHLFAGTHLDNATDKQTKGRGNQAAGEGNGQSKLTAENVREIRRLHANGGILHRELAAMFGIRKEAVGKIIARKLWAHLA